MAVAFEELENSPRLTISAGKFRGVREFKVAWADHADFILELLGGYRIVGGQPVVVPAAGFPGWFGSIAEEVSVEPFPPDNPNGAAIRSIYEGANLYSFAKVIATYGVPDNRNTANRPGLPNVPAGTFLSFSSDFGADYLSTPSGWWKWSSDGEKLNTEDAPPPGFLLGTEDFTLTWHRVLSPPWSEIRSARGKINSAPFLDHPAGHVMFMGGRTGIDVDFGQLSVWRLEYAFKAKSHHWNHFFRRDAGFEEIESDSGQPPFPSTNFASLFQFGS